MSGSWSFTRSMTCPVGSVEREWAPSESHLPCSLRTQLHAHVGVEGMGTDSDFLRRPASVLRLSEKFMKYTLVPRGVLTLLERGPCLHALFLYKLVSHCVARDKAQSYCPKPQLQSHGHLSPVHPSPNCPFSRSALGAEWVTLSPCWALRDNGHSRHPLFLPWFPCLRAGPGVTSTYKCPWNLSPFLFFLISSYLNNYIGPLKSLCLQASLFAPLSLAYRVTFLAAMSDHTVLLLHPMETTQRSQGHI